jgi:hypothetical protein
MKSRIHTITCNMKPNLSGARPASAVSMSGDRLRPSKCCSGLQRADRVGHVTHTGSPVDVRSIIDSSWSEPATSTTMQFLRCLGWPCTISAPDRYGKCRSVQAFGLEMRRLETPSWVVLFRPGSPSRHLGRE